MSRQYFIVHIILVIILSLIVICVISQDVCPSPGDYISGVGSVASLYGIIITLWQVSQVKKVATAASEAVDRKLEEIDSFMAFADVKRHIEICNSINVYLTSKEYEAAAIKIEQLREMLVNLKQSNELQDDDFKSASSHILNLGTDSQSIRKHRAGIVKLDSDVLITHISDVCNFLEEVSSKIKKINYDKREV
jgi:hypothetical protein